MFEHNPVFLVFSVVALLISACALAEPCHSEAGSHTRRPTAIEEHSRGPLELRRCRRPRALATQPSIPHRRRQQSPIDRAHRRGWPSSLLNQPGNPQQRAHCRGRVRAREQHGGGWQTLQPGSVPPSRTQRAPGQRTELSDRAAPGAKADDGSTAAVGVFLNKVPPPPPMRPSGITCLPRSSRPPTWAPPSMPPSSCR